MDIHIRKLPLAPNSRLSQWLRSSVRASCCRGLSPVQHFRVLDAPFFEEGLYTFFDLVKSDKDPDTCCYVETTEALIQPKVGNFKKVSLFDICNGMGGFSLGSQILGMATDASVECNPLACMALRANFAGPVYEGDLQDDEFLKKLLRKEGNFTELAGGFPCQGYSHQADQMGLDYHRSHCLYHILSYAWFLQVQAILLECVANVMQVNQTQECLERHARDAGMSCHKLVFDLQHQWPVRRNRFWCYMIDKDFPTPSISPWPIPHLSSSSSRT